MAKTTTVACALAMMLCAGQATAGTLTYELGLEYSGATAPQGSAPWLTATFDDGGSAGTVDLTLEATNLVDIEFVGEWLFNLDPALDPTSLSFGAPSKTGIFDDPAFNTGVDAHHAAGDGNFDIQVEFTNSNGDSTKFGLGESLTVEISGIASLLASSFDFLSDPNGASHGPFPTVAHVQSIGGAGQDSGWITVPEPSTFVLGAMGLVGLLAIARRKRRNV